MKKIATNENYRPYFRSIVTIWVAIALYFAFKKCISINIVDIKQLANTLITIISIFISLVLVGITIILQKDSDSMKSIKANWLYDTLLRFLKEPLFWCVIVLLMSIILALWWYRIRFLFVYIFGLLLVFLTTWRVFKYLFRILKEDQ